MVRGIIFLIVSFIFKIINVKYVQEVAPNDHNFIGLLNVVFFALFLVGLYFLITWYIKYENNKVNGSNKHTDDKDIDYDILSKMPQSLKDEFLFEKYKEQNWNELM